MLQITARPSALVLAAVALVGVSACGDDSPDRPGGQLEIDGESPLITDPGGVANDLTDD